MAKQKILLIDSNALIHRAYHAVPPFKTKDGTPVGAVYGFVSTYLKAIEDIKPQYVVATYDLAGPTFRDEIYEDYKATRTKSDDDLYVQIPLTQEVLASLNVPIFSVEGYEADDVIGSITRLVEATTSSLEIYILTGDMDITQLINDRVRVYTLKKGIKDQVVYDTAAIVEKYGFGPDRIVDYKSLRGDPSDNIPGVKGIGEKTAIDLITRYGGIDDIYALLDEGALEVTPRILELLKDGRENAYMSRELATIHTTIPLKDFSLEKCLTHDFDLQEATRVFHAFEFKSLLPRLLKMAQKTGQQQGLFSDNKNEDIQKVSIFRYETIVVQDTDALHEMISRLEKSKVFSFDTETTGLSPINDDLVGFSFSDGVTAWYVPIGHKTGTQLKLTDVLPAISQLMASTNHTKVAHNLKFDALVLRKVGIEIAFPIFDTMIASYLLDPQRQGHGLDAVAYIEFGHENIPISSLIGTGKNQITFDAVSIDLAGPYAAEDAYVAFKIYEVLSPRIEADESIKNIFNNVEMPILDVLVQMEKNGIRLDKEILKDISRTVDARLLELSEKIVEQAGEDFNINSTQQLSHILFEKLQIDSQDIKKNKTGMSTAAAELEKMRGLHPIIELILEYRELNKLKNTYLDALPTMVASDGRIHTSYSQIVASTGRLSSSDPNLQNIPVRTPLGAQIRNAFAAETGNVLVVCDYSQIELRVIASIAKDEKMLAAFRDNRDIHTETAAAIFDVAASSVTKDQRRIAKTVNFGIIYGISAFGLSQTIHTDVATAKKFIDDYFVQFPRIKQYMDDTLKFVGQRGYVETLIGRKRYLPDIFSGVAQARKAAERMAINMPIQGTAADIMKAAMIAVQKEILDKNTDIRMILQVHDELIFEMPLGRHEEIARQIKAVMENAAQIDCPLVVDTGFGNNWGEAK